MPALRAAGASSALRDLADRAAFRVGFLGDRGALLVADDRIQRRDQDRIAIQRLGQPRLVDLEAGDRTVGQRARTRCASRRMLSAGCSAITRQHHVELEVAGLPGDR